MTRTDQGPDLGRPDRAGERPLTGASEKSQRPVADDHAIGGPFLPEDVAAEQKRQLCKFGAWSAVAFLATLSVPTFAAADNALPATQSIAAMVVGVSTVSGRPYTARAHGPDPSAAKAGALARFAGRPGVVEDVFTSDQCVAVVYDPKSPSARMGVAEAAIAADAIPAAYRELGITDPHSPEGARLEAAVSCPERPAAGLPLEKDSNAIGYASQTLTQQWQLLASQGWTFRWGEAGKGTYANRSDQQIVLDENTKKDPLRAVADFAHEAGHGINPYSARDRTGRYCFRARMTNEGKAELNKERVGDEIQESTDVDISPNDPWDTKTAYLYTQAYKRYEDSGFDPTVRDEDAAAVGVVWEDYHPSTNPDSTYRETYERDCRLQQFSKIAGPAGNGLVAVSATMNAAAAWQAVLLANPLRRRRT